MAQLEFVERESVMDCACSVCRAGFYKECSIHDDLEGKLTCNNCGHRVDSHVEVWKDVNA